MWQGMKIFNTDLILFVFKIKEPLWMSCLSCLSVALWSSEWLEALNQFWVMLPLVSSEVMEECSSFFRNKVIFVIEKTSFGLIVEFRGAFSWTKCCGSAYAGLCERVREMGNETTDNQWNHCHWHCHFVHWSSPCCECPHLLLLLGLECPHLLLLRTSKRFVNKVCSQSLLVV